jgi:hypothetical protein
VKELSLEKQIYLCKYHDIDKDLKSTMGLNEQEVQEYIKKFKQNGLYGQYRNLNEYEYEDMIKKDKKKNKFEKILDKYRFDRNNKGYKSLAQVLDLSSKCKNTKALSLEKVFKQVAENLKVKSYIINNDCKRLLDATYIQNKTLFKFYDYNKKPTVKEFIIKELKIPIAKENGFENIVGLKRKEHICETKEKVNKTKKTTLYDELQKIEEAEKIYIKVSLKTIMKWSYQKRIFR